MTTTARGPPTSITGAVADRTLPEEVITDDAADAGRAAAGQERSDSRDRGRRMTSTAVSRWG